MMIKRIIYAIIVKLFLTTAYKGLVTSKYQAFCHIELEIIHCVYAKSSNMLQVAFK